MEIRNMIIDLNPNDELVDIDIEKIDYLMTFNNLNSVQEFRLVLTQAVNMKDNEIVYIHYYSVDNVYTVGIKVRD